MQIREICNAMPNSESGRQTLLFSATMPKLLIEFTKCGIMDSDPKVVRLDKDASVSEELRIGFITVRSQEKDAALLHLLRDVLPNAIKKDEQKLKQIKAKSKKKKGKNNEDDDWVGQHALGMTLIFAATRHHVDFLTTLINNAGIGNGPGHEDVAACIYGTMDQDARRLNLSAFRSGRTPILIVTDVAARGIDVPLIDHVIHYSFPPTAKLFVHRSGRAARAGRIGYCWGLVDTEEMPYMVDLYLFLGRKLSTGRTEAIKSEKDGNAEKDKDEAKQQEEDVMYSVQEMTPDMVHYGSMPESTSNQEVENVRRILESELTGSHEAELLRSLVRICNNAMKQYRRSRPESSRQGVRRAKAILEGAKEKSGKRVGGGMIPAHPVLRKAEIDRIMGTTGATEASAKVKLGELKQREEMLRAMSNYRPKETVFEAFAQGGGKTVGILGQVDKGRTTANGSSKKYDASAAFTSMKAMRRQMALAHQKGKSLIVAGSDKALVMNGELDEPTIDSEEIDINSLDMISSLQKNSQPGSNTKKVEVVEKRRLSKAERKRMKKTGSKGVVPSGDRAEKRAKDKRGDDFRDKSFYIDNISSNMEEDQRNRHIEKAMQPSAASGKDGMQSALRLEEAMLDIVGDENTDLVKKQRITRWDKSKRKYVQTTVGMETSGLSKTKKLKLESGQMVNSNKVKLGELYEKWQKKTNKSIGRVGVFDDIAGDNDVGVADPSGYARKTPAIKKKQASDDEIKSATQIRKKREIDKKTQIKNMPKKERAQLYANKRAAQNKKAAEAAASGQGWQGKKGFSGRYGQTPKGKYVNKGK
jgi:ATP-dependent RNA helicase DDX54/DBP10